MKAREVQTRLAQVTGYQIGEIDQRTRHLYTHNLIPTGPRGFFAPDMEPLHVALMTLCLTPRRAADAAQVMVRAMSLRAVPRPGVSWPFGTVNQLAPVLGTGFATTKPVFSRVEVHCDGAMAWVEFALDDFRDRVLFTDQDEVRQSVVDFPDAYDATGAMYGGHRLVITGALAQQLALELQDDANAGYAERKAG